LVYKKTIKIKGDLQLMAETKVKEKKVTEREKFMYEVAQILMEAMDLDELNRSKEGLVFNRGEEQVVVKFIQKKNKVYREDIVENIARLYSFDAVEEVETEDFVDETETVEVAM
jgi:hypothetical protein